MTSFFLLNDFTESFNQNASGLFVLALFCKIITHNCFHALAQIVTVLCVSRANFASFSLTVLEQSLLIRSTILTRCNCLRVKTKCTNQTRKFFPFGFSILYDRSCCKSTGGVGRQSYFASRQSLGFWLLFGANVFECVTNGRIDSLSHKPNWFSLCHRQPLMCRNNLAQLQFSLYMYVCSNGVFSSYPNIDLGNLVLEVCVCV